MYQKERGDFTRMPYLQTSCTTENIQVTEGRMLASSDFNVCVCTHTHTHTLIWMVITVSQDSLLIYEYT